MVSNQKHHFLCNLSTTKAESPCSTAICGGTLVHLESVCTASTNHKLALQMPPRCQESGSSISASAGTGLLGRWDSAALRICWAVKCAQVAETHAAWAGFQLCATNQASYSECSLPRFPNGLNAAANPCDPGWLPAAAAPLANPGSHPDSSPRLHAQRLLNAVADLSNPGSLLIQRLLDCCRNLMLHVWHLLSIKSLLHRNVCLLLGSILQAWQAYWTSPSGTPHTAIDLQLGCNCTARALRKQHRLKPPLLSIEASSTAMSASLATSCTLQTCQTRSTAAGWTACAAAFFLHLNCTQSASPRCRLLEQLAANT